MSMRPDTAARSEAEGKVAEAHGKARHLWQR